MAGAPKLIGRFERRRDKLMTWANELREQRPMVDYSVGLWERDQEAFASVLGSAIALRLFLFVIPANVALVGLVELVRAGSLMDAHLEDSAITGELARSLSGLGWWSSLSLFVTGLVLTLWSGRALTRVLATCSVSAWRLNTKDSKTKVPTIVALSGVFFMTIIAASVFTRVREIGGVTASLIAWLLITGTAGLAWFVVMMTLPRATNDPGALLPGAALVGVAYAAVQWFMQLYLPNRIERTSDRLGGLATTVATLGYFFIIGRIMSSSFVVSAVTFERFGSLSQVIFDLPLLNRLKSRFPRLSTFFDLPQTETSESGATVEPVESVESARS